MMLQSTVQFVGDWTRIKLVQVFLGMAEGTWSVRFCLLAQTARLVEKLASGNHPAYQSYCAGASGGDRLSRQKQFTQSLIVNLSQNGDRLLAAFDVSAQVEPTP
jgi:hypothetical protein